MNVDLEKVEKLVKMIENSTLSEFSYAEGDFQIHMNKTQIAQTVSQVSAEVISEKTTDDEVVVEQYITSPIVGTFYSASSPDAKPFVTVGDKVKAGTTVCILEAMKLLNEIESDDDCTIEAVLVSNGQKVEYGQPLFRIKIQD